MHVRRVQKIGNSFYTIIPKAYLNHLGWTRGEWIAVVVEDDHIRLYKLERAMKVLKKGELALGSRKKKTK